MIPDILPVSNGTPPFRGMREAMPAVLVYGEYPMLVAARTVALWHFDCVATASLDVNETLALASSFDLLVVCTSASPEAVTRLRVEQAALPRTSFLFLGRADIGEAKRWLGRVVEWKRSFTPAKRAIQAVR